MKHCPKCNRNWNVEGNQKCPYCNCGLMAGSSPASCSDDLELVKSELYQIAAKLGELRDRLSDPRHSSCAHEIGQTMMALGIAVDTIKRVKKNDPLPTLEDVQRIYRQNDPDQRPVEHP